jgi:hypothetical protein
MQDKYHREGSATQPFTSGYSDDIIATKGVLEDGLAFISKPIKPVEFLKRMREILDS